MEKEETKKSTYLPYVPDEDEVDAIRECFDTLSRGQGVLNKSYDYFNGRSLIEAIDDWTKRWNGYIPPLNPLLTIAQSQIFFNFTRNAIIAKLAKYAMQPVKAKIEAVNKKSGLPDKEFAQFISDANDYSLKAENAESKFLQSGLEATTKGTVVVYEGYMRTEQKRKIPQTFDTETGKYTYKVESQVTFDNCYQQIVPIEDFYILNPFQPDVQKQPKIIWKTLTSYDEAHTEFSKYANWKCVKPGMIFTPDPTSFYRETLLTELQPDQAEIVRYYCKSENRHIIMVNGIILYDGPMPFKDGNYPFAKSINEPFANDFFWGNGDPGKYMGEQDLINTFLNLMADKTINSLVPTGLSSDLDDLVEDDVIEIGKIRKVGNVENWKWWEAPEVGGGEYNVFQQVLSLARESASSDASQGTTPRGGKQTARQILLKQQEVMQKLSFNLSFLENLERDRTVLRINHILQFYSIPKLEKITGKDGQTIQKLVYRDIHLDGVKLSNGESGSKIIKVVGEEYSDPDKREELADQLSLTEAVAEDKGIKVEASAVVANFFHDYNFLITVVKYSSFENNQALDQAARMEYANWRIPMALPPAPGMPAVAPADVPAIVKWVEESFDAPTEDFEPEPLSPLQNPMMQPQGAPAQGGPSGKPQVLNQMQPSNMRESATNEQFGL